jgi:inorganic triphosphatase YgiF
MSAERTPREVEGVLLVSADDPAAVGRRLAAVDTLAGFDLLPREPEQLHDVYLDTDDGDLTGLRVAFRLREVDGRPLLTLKADARRAGTASERLELEAPWSDQALRAALDELRRRGARLPDRPAGPGADQGEPLAVLAGLGLHPTQVRETTRTPRNVVERGRRDAGPVAELALDAVAYRLPGATVRLLEVEVEAKGPGGLDTVQELLGAMANSFPADLRPWPWGKLATGRAAQLLLGQGRLEGLLDPAGMLRPQAYDVLAEFLSASTP